MTRLRTNISINNTGVVFQNIETLITGGGTVLTAAQFESFDTIMSFNGPVFEVALTLVASATLDLVDETVGRAVNLRGASGDDVLTLGGGMTASWVLTAMTF